MKEESNNERILRLYGHLIRHRTYFYHMGLWESAEIVDATLVADYWSFINRKGAAVYGEKNE